MSLILMVASYWLFSSIDIMHCLVLMHINVEEVGIFDQVLGKLKMGTQSSLSCKGCQKNNQTLKIIIGLHTYFPQS